MRQFIDVFNKDDLRYILKEYDENVKQDDLKEYFDNIMEEYRSLTGNDEYERHIHKIELRQYKELQIKAYRRIIQCVEFGLNDVAEEMIKLFNFSLKITKPIETIKNAERAIKSILTTLQIQDIQEKENAPKKQNIKWAGLIVYIHRTIGIKIEYDCTVELYCEYEQQANDYIKAKKNG